MEACGSAHYWAREIESRGHKVKLMVPRYVKGYMKRGKNDAADAEAICEAVTRRHVEAVAAKTVDQQCLLMLHKIRDSLVGDRGAHKCNETSRRLETIPGIGLMGATAFAGIADEVKAYKSARHYAASLGVTPRITGTGGEVQLGPISKQGSGYLRRTLYLGAKSRLAWAKRNPAKADPKLLQLLQDKAFNVAAIALANQMARTVWALLVRGGGYIADHRPAAFASRETARQ
jgi:transposase